jgi:hypothetical protein
MLICSSWILLLAIVLELVELIDSSFSPVATKTFQEQEQIELSTHNASSRAKNPSKPQSQENPATN